MVRSSMTSSFRDESYCEAEVTGFLDVEFRRPLLLFICRIHRRFWSIAILCLTYLHLLGWTPVQRPKVCDFTLNRSAKDGPRSD
jgi:hypothetical protein